ncbi:MAG: alpha/beta hydrolase [Novosphingobium sp.]|nr:alpha/beta hydrolase [Novosphingobium sp.]
MSNLAFFPGFTEGRITVDGVGIHYVTGGSGPPLLLVHGAPESGTMWHKVAAILRDRFTLVVPDLRGYGRSDKPASGDYTKRAMAADMAALMSHLGFDRFGAAGHDRGARVVRRLMKDHPLRVERGAVLDIVPTRWIYDHMDDRVAIGLWNWVMFVAPHAERILNFRAMLEGLRHLGDDKAVDDYLQTNGNPEAHHAMCEDYRAGYHICRHQDADDADTVIAAPLLVLWGEKSATTASLFDVRASWAGEGTDLSFASLPCGHFIPEERPEDTARLLGDFFGRH